MVFEKFSKYQKYLHSLFLSMLDCNGLESTIAFGGDCRVSPTNSCCGIMTEPAAVDSVFDIFSFVLVSSDSSINDGKLFIIFDEWPTELSESLN